MSRLSSDRAVHEAVLGLGSLMLAIGLVMGCAQDDVPVVYIVNHSNVSVDVLTVAVGGTEGSVIFPGLKPGLAFGYDRIPSDGCTVMQLVARDSQGVEIARSQSPVCRPSTWVIEAVGASPSGT